MKELFLNFVKCAYISVMQMDLLATSGVICCEFLDQYFYDSENSILDTAFQGIIKCLNLKKCEKIYEDNSVFAYDYEDGYGRSYDASKIYAAFTVKHQLRWYDDFWSCVVNGNEGNETLLEEAQQDVRVYEEYIDKRRRFWLDAKNSCM